MYFQMIPAMIKFLDDQQSTREIWVFYVFFFLGGGGGGQMAHWMPMTKPNERDENENYYLLW